MYYISVNRKIHRAYNRVREGNFSLNGLLGFNLYQRTVGIIGTGKIGLILGQIMKGFGCNLLAYDVYRHPELEALVDTPRSKDTGILNRIVVKTT
ncbi:hypothetical protein MEN41_15305, partial [Dolichospermum sp. ST_con]|nr:hypothetical protein [Dolichospermum sp. ST_con]MDD1453461.1 hypothetical protein [Dolichospermum sp. ST_sed7]